MRSWPLLLFVCIMTIVFMTSTLYGQSKEAIQFHKKGQNSYKQRLLIQAVVDYTEAISLFPEYIEALYTRGNIFIELGEETAAIKDFERILEIDASSLMPKIHLMDLYESLDMNADGIRIATLMVQENPENIGAALMKRGVFFEKAEDFKSAKTDYTDFLKIEDEYYKQFKKGIKERMKKL